MEDIDFFDLFGVSSATRTCDHTESVFTCMSCAFMADMIGDTDPGWSKGILETLREKSE